jgi:hypothetical protein
VPRRRKTRAVRSGTAPRTAEIPAARRWLWRIITAGVIPLLAVALVETGFRLAAYGYPTAFLLQTPDGERLVSNPRFGWRFFPAGMARTPEPVVLETRKPESSLRVVVLGGSAALGFPDAAFGFSRYLEAAMRERAPDLRIEVANAAMTAIDSTVVREIAADCLRHEPDVLVVMTGNNEVVGPFGQVPFRAMAWHGGGPTDRAALPRVGGNGRVPGVPATERGRIVGARLPAVSTQPVGLLPRSLAAERTRSAADRAGESA